MPSNAGAAAALAAQTDLAMAGLVEAAREDAAEPPVQRVASSTPQTAAAPEEEAHDAAPEPAEDFDLGAELPEDLAYLINEDYEDDDEEPVSYQETQTQPAYEDDEYVDPDTLELRKRLEAAEKRAAFLEKQSVKQGRRMWAKEAEKYFPLSDAESINATSRRGFLREAKAQHERMLPIVKKIQAKERARIREQAKTEGWGPAMNAGGSPVPPATLEQEIAKARRGGLANVYKTMIRGGM